MGYIRPVDGELYSFRSSAVVNVLESDGTGVDSSSEGHLLSINRDYITQTADLITDKCSLGAISLPEITKVLTASSRLTWIMKTEYRRRLQ